MTASKKPLVTRLDFTMSDDVAKRLDELQDSIRKIAGHSRPTPKTVVSALIMAEHRRAKQLEDELLVSYRLTDPDAD